jgi:hypothetical protein
MGIALMRAGFLWEIVRSAAKRATEVACPVPIRFELAERSEAVYK